MQRDVGLKMSTVSIHFRYNWHQHRCFAIWMVVVDAIKILKREERVGSQIENTFSAEIIEWSVLYD